MKIIADILVLLATLIYCSADVQLVELQPDQLSLLNVAVKARLLERLTEETDEIQFERNELVNRNKNCLLNVSTTARSCKQCVVDKCLKRGRECKLSSDELEHISDKIKNNSIPGVDFLSQPSVVQEEIREIKETAEKDIIEEVPEKLKPKGKTIIQKMKNGMVIIHGTLNRAVMGLPELLPKIEQNIADVGSMVDMNAVQDIADQAASEITEVITDPTFTGIRVNVVNGNQVIKENLPSIMQAMGSTFNRLKSAVGKFVGVVRVQAGTAWKQANVNHNEPEASGIPNGNGNMLNNGPQIPSREMNFPELSNVVQIQQPLVNDFDFPNQPPNQFQNMPPNQFQDMPINQFQNMQPNQFQNMQPMPFNGRLRRQADVPCSSIKGKLYNACHSYHFYCTACMNEKTVLEHDCGREALVAMVAIKQLDLKTGSDLVKYRSLVKKGELVKKVLYDKNSFDIDSGTYSRSYITIQIEDKKTKVFGTSLLPDVLNIKHAGFVIADELWDKGLDGVDYETSSFARIEESTKFHTEHKTDFIKSEPQKSSAAITGFLWGTCGLIMYLGYVAITVMVY